MTRAGRRSSPRSSAAPGPRRRSAAPGRVLGLAALLVSLRAGDALASAASLRRELQGFAGSDRAAGLSFCAIFFPLPAGPAPVGTSERGRAPDGANGEASGRVWVGAEDPLVPASLAKLTTTIFALDALGSDFTFRTRLLAAGDLTADTLRGDLFLVGGGDPFLVSERLWLLAQALRATGLRHITGGLRVDTSWISPDSADPVRARDREFSERPYAAKLSALAVNFNAAAVRLRPAAAPGLPASVELDPLPCSYLRLAGGLRTVGANEPQSWTVTLEPDSLGETVRVEGSIRVDSPPSVEYRSVRDPDRFSASLVRAFLEAAGITIAGPTAPGVAPVAARLLVDFPSLPLRDLVDAANRFSNNLMADQIALAFSAWADSNGRANGAAEGSHPASLTEAGRRMTRRLRQEFGAGADVAQLDGSGLSTGNRLTGSVLVRLLERAWSDLRIGPEIAASLPMPGGDGTLRRRFGEGKAGALRAKTGTMSSPAVSGMAGYLDAARSRPVAFVLLMNGRAPAWDLARMRALQESWVREYLRE